MKGPFYTSEGQRKASLKLGKSEWRNIIKVWVAFQNNINKAFKNIL
jgi:hypothetical protein